MNNQKQNQCFRIQMYLENNEYITPLEAWSKLSIYRLASRISDMKKRGVPIDSEFIECENKYGEKCRVKKYFLRKEKAVI